MGVAERHTWTIVTAIRLSEDTEIAVLVLRELGEESLE